MNISINGLLLFLLLCLIISPVVIRLLRGEKRFDYFEPLFILLLLFFFGFFVKGLLVLQDDQFFILRSVRKDDTYITLSILASIVGLTAFYVGYFSKMWVIIGRMLPSLPPAIGLKSAVPATVFLFIVGFAGYLIVMVAEGGPASLAHKAFFERTIYFGRGWLYYNIFSLWLSLAVFLSYIKARGRKFYLLPSFYLLFLVVLLITASLGNRYFVVSLFILSVLFYHYKYKRIRIVQLGMGVAFLFLVLLGTLHLRQPEVFSRLGVIDGLLLTLASTFQIVDNFAIILEYIPAYHDFFGGRIEFEALTYATVYPRTLFPDKPLIWGLTRLQTVYIPDYQFVGYSASIFGPSYADFGWAGIVGSMVFLGAWARAIYMKSLANSFSGPYLIVLCHLIVSLNLIFADGTAFFLGNLPTYIIMILLFRLIGSRKVNDVN